MDEESIEEAVSEVLSGHSEVVAAYLFGSRAEGRHHEESDLDIGLLFDEEPEGFPEFEIARGIEQRLPIPVEVDARKLNGAGLRFLHQVLQGGQKIYVSDPEAVARFEADLFRGYMDMRPLIEEHSNPSDSTSAQTAEGSLEHDRIRMERLRG